MPVRKRISHQELGRKTKKHYGKARPRLARLVYGEKPRRLDGETGNCVLSS